MANLDPLFFPRNIAVIGASNRPLTIGHRIITNQLRYGFTGKVYPVNPKGGEIVGRKAHKSILDVPDDVDLVHIIVRNTLVAPVLEDCAKKGIKVAVVNTSGFKEIGPKGAELEKQIIEIGKRTGIRLFGPNCQGVMNTDPKASLYSNFTFATMRPGHVSMVCQGGGVAEVINNYFGMKQVGQRMYASNGNACDISIPEILEYYGDDDETHVIVLHVESFANPAAFLERVKPVAAKKPILALKSGVTEEGARAVSSHTGGLMAQDTVTDVLFDKCGILRFHSLSELCETAEAFNHQPVPNSNRIGMVTNAGSPAIIVTDEAVQAGLQVPDLSENSKAFLKEHLQSIASVANPIDMMATASGEEFKNSLNALLQDPNLDAAVVCFMTPFFVDTIGIANAVKELAATTDKTLIAVAMTNPEEKPEWKETVDIVRGAGVPVYYFPASAARVLYNMDLFRRLRDRPQAAPPDLDVDRAKAADLIKNADTGSSGFMKAEDAAALLRAYRIPVAKEKRGENLAEIKAAAAELGYPVVLKAEAPDLVHKSEAGAVVLNLESEPELEQAFTALNSKLGKTVGLRFLVQKHHKDGLEVIVGGARSENLPPMVMFGLGGIYVEVFKDVKFKLTPLSSPEAREMITSISAAPLLEGVRGKPGIDKEALADILLRVAQLLSENPQITELDLNPVLSFPEGKPAVAVDFRIKIRKN